MVRSSTSELSASALERSHVGGVSEEPSLQELASSDYQLVAGPTPSMGRGGQYPAAFVIDTHSHDRDQLLYPGTGMMTVNTAHGAWLLPPERALWIPAGIHHSVSMVGAVSTRSLFTDPGLQVRSSPQCQVVRVSPLLHELLGTAYETRDMPDDLRKNLLMSILMMEIRRAPVEALPLAIPRAKLLATKCQKYLANPTPHETIDAWCDELAMSRRAFTRLFRRETGQSFASWRQQACLFAALPRLAAGETVTAVAFGLGYSSTAAFTSMFRRVLGVTPRNYFNHDQSPSADLNAEPGHSAAA